jgi:hypothetical protein
MMKAWQTFGIIAMGMVVPASPALADGKVFAEPVIQAPVEVADQQALIQFANGVERLVIETAFLGEGTNFAWVIPLPAAPEIRPVAEGFFAGLRPAFQPQLIHRVTRYYLGVAFVCALGFLAWRSFKDETSWVTDLPLCLIVAAGVGLAGRSFLLALATLGWALYTRLFTRSTQGFTIVVLVGMALSVAVTLFSPLERAMIVTLGSEGGDPEVAGVTVVSVQRAGVFESTTIRGTDPQSLMRWLRKNGYHAPGSIEPVVHSYVERGWVFVASKVRRTGLARALTAPHPLLFTFSTPTPVYPMKLTGVDNGECTVDLYVFGERRAAARYFRIARCDRLTPGLRGRITTSPFVEHEDAEVWINATPIGTKLTASLSPRQMQSDVEIKWRGFSRKGAYAFSPSGAATVALNVAVPLGILSWLFVGAMGGEWGEAGTFVRRWRWRVALATIALGLVVFLLLPKVEVVSAL